MASIQIVLAEQNTWVSHQNSHSDSSFDFVAFVSSSAESPNTWHVHQEVGGQNRGPHEELVAGVLDAAGRQESHVVRVDVLSDLANNIGVVSREWWVV